MSIGGGRATCPGPFLLETRARRTCVGAPAAVANALADALASCGV